MRVIVSGPRYTDSGKMHEFSDSSAMASAMAASGFTPSLVISGGAIGCDRLGEQWAIARGIPVKVIPANWKAYGKSAGPIRNRMMAIEAGTGGGLVAILMPHARGTRNMIKQAREQGLVVYVHRILP